MSDTSWRDRGAMVLAALAIVSVVAVVWISNWTVEVPQEAIEPIKNRYITTQDTLAQWLMAGLSFVATIASVAAVFLVKATLDLNRQATLSAVAAANAAVEANKDAREQFAIEQRPWLTTDRPKISAAIDENSILIYFTIKARNIGASPAFSAQLITEVTASQSSREDAVLVRLFGERVARAGLEGFHGRLIFPARDREFWAYAEEEIDPNYEPTSITVRYAISYRGSGIDRTLVTAGEVIFPVRRKLYEPAASGLVEVTTYEHYGASHAT